MKPQIVLMPGLDGTGRLFDRVLPHLPTEPAPLVIRYPTDEPMGYAELEPLVLEQLRGCGPILLVAESFSGPLALRMAKHPQLRVAGLVFVASFVANPFRFLRPWTRSLLPRWAFVLHTQQMIRYLLTGRDGSDEVVEGVASAMDMLDPSVVLHRVREIVSADEWRRFATVQVPMALLLASRDRLVPRAHAQRMSRRRPDLEIVSIDAPHLVLQCAPAPAARAIVDFATRVEAL